MQPIRDNLVTCFDCENQIYKDGYCEAHWNFMFESMTNHERMVAKANLRKARKGELNETNH